MKLKVLENLVGVNKHRRYYAPRRVESAEEIVESIRNRKATPAHIAINRIRKRITR